ncbi:hypothetical protein Fmac_006365 [Flemingia macrophylla]|uniref:Uncharacterized protein n=1 Tax=Flemingia macrophylla TaxID=520843 RepID=A0ABD1ND54_9FABA
MPTSPETDSPTDGRSPAMFRRSTSILPRRRVTSRPRPCACSTGSSTISELGLLCYPAYNLWTINTVKIRQYTM